MLELTFRNDRPVIAQHPIKPVVYLDHWALARISRDEALGKRFVQAMQRCQGTLALSRVNIDEFSGPTDIDQARLAEALIDGLGPQLFLINYHFLEVMDREDAKLKGFFPASRAPHSDDEFLDTLMRQGGVRGWSIGTLFQQAVQNRAAAQKQFDEAAKLGAQVIELIRRQVDADPVWRKFSKGHIPPMSRAWSTKVFFFSLLFEWDKNKTLKFERSDMTDFMHAVVPCVYCDFVLLDGKWADMVRRIREKYRAAGFHTHLARVFSERDDGMDRFLETLESFDECELFIGQRDGPEAIQWLERIMRITGAAT